MKVARPMGPAPNTALLNVLRLSGILLIAALAIAIASYFGVRSTISGSKTQLLESFFLAILPLLVYLALTRPFIFPFGLYAALVPVDNLLAITSLYSAQATGQSAHVATITKVLGLASGLAFTLWLLRNRRYVSPPRALLAWSALLVWMAMSVFWALDTNAALEHLTTYAELMILLFVVAIMPVSDADLKALITAVVLGALGTAAYSIYQYHEGGGVLHQNINQLLLHASSRLKNGAAEIDPNALTATMLTPIAITLTAFLQRRWSLKKLGFLLVVLMLLAGVFVTASRGGIVALLVMLVYLWFRSRYRAQVFTLSIAMLIASLARGAANGVWSRFADAARTGGSGRTSIWRVGLDAFKHHWLLGAGVGNFPIAYNRSYIHIFESYNQGWNRVSHNTPLGVAVELGIVGLALGAVAAFLHMRMLRSIPEADKLYDLRVGLESAFVGLFVASVFLWVLPGKYTWLTLALIAAVRTYAVCTAGQQRVNVVRAPVGISSFTPHPGGQPKVSLNL